MSFRESLRAEIVKLAGEIVQSEGLEAVQARRIAREAGCAVGTIYNVFGDIDGLIIAVNASTLAMLGEVVSLEGRSPPGTPLVERLELQALAYVRFALRHSRRWEAVFKHRLPASREAPPSYLEDQMRLLAKIEEAIAEVISDPHEREATARAMFGAVHGIVALALDNRLGGRTRGDLEDQVRLIVGLIAHGLERRREDRA